MLDTVFIGYGFIGQSYILTLLGTDTAEKYEIIYLFTMIYTT
jgi:hypothetical protein